MATQILAVAKDNKHTWVTNIEQACRFARTRPDGYYDFYRMNFGPRSTKPTLEKITIKVTEEKRPVYTLRDSNGKVVADE